MACILSMHGLFPCLPLLSRQCNINITYLTILFKNVCVFVFVCLHDFMCTIYVQVPTEARGSPGAEVTDNCELPDMVVEN